MRHEEDTIISIGFGKERRNLRIPSRHLKCVTSSVISASPPHPDIFGILDTCLPRRARPIASETVAPPLSFGTEHKALTRGPSS